MGKGIIWLKEGYSRQELRLEDRDAMMFAAQLVSYPVSIG